ncbi:Response regulator receiver domain-containing protein [Haloarcula vallismortis]|uniref:HoxA-like transcriptional regulator n=2 Tax=Haloarcula vallismortis TaxID=28442 RepID=M0JCD4_HALVA|nr:HalX domain-containing protein [Haloarcula vallismortis]EMA06631.1 HoxA-like transcriptional regulator [Haloarcula vallismortis ATCC 29715]SDW61671.1 Response regulator receiver domain-containing protein [Haloarcula vallismortis]
MQKRGETEEATVLVVDDEQDIADLYSTWLLTAHDVRTAHSGSEALQLVDASVDVVFLDRQMPDMSGDEVLDTIAERGIDPTVVMVTAVDPDFDIVEMPFDEYLTKPVSRADLLDTVSEMLVRTTYDSQVQEYFAVASKKATLETQKTRPKLEASDEYQTVNEQFHELRERVDATAAEIDDFESVFQQFPGSGLSSG